MAARPHRQAAVREDRVGRRQIERRDEPGAERQGGHVGQVAQSRRPRPGRAHGREPDSAAAGATAARLFGLDAAPSRSVSSLRRFVVARCAASTPPAPAARSIAGPSSSDTGEKPPLERGRVDERLEGGAGLAAAARGAVERRAVKSRPPTMARTSPVCGIDARPAPPAGRGSPSRRRPSTRPPARPRPAGPGTKVVCTFQSGGWSPPKRVPELLAQVLLRVAAAGVRRRRVRADARTRAPARASLLRVGDVALLAHARQHDVAALDGAVEVRPGRQRGGRADEAGDERRLGQRQRPAPACRTRAATSPRRRRRRRSGRCGSGTARGSASLVSCSSSSSARTASLRLAAVACAVGQEQRARELLRDRAAALDACPARACCARSPGRGRSGRCRDAGRSDGLRRRRPRAAGAARSGPAARPAAARPGGTSGRPSAV